MNFCGILLFVLLYSHADFAQGGSSTSAMTSASTAASTAASTVASTAASTVASTAASTVASTAASTVASTAASTAATGAASTSAAAATSTSAAAATSTAGVGATSTAGTGSTTTAGAGATSTTGTGASSTAASGATSTAGAGIKCFSAMCTGQECLSNITGDNSGNCTTTGACKLVEDKSGANPVYNMTCVSVGCTLINININIKSNCCTTNLCNNKISLLTSSSRGSGIVYTAWSLLASSCLYYVVLN